MSEDQAEYAIKNGVHFDDLVHEVMARRAAVINNQGALAQVQFLLSEGFSLKDITDWEGGK